MNEHTAQLTQVPTATNTDQHVKIKRFAVYGLTSTDALHFESTSDLGVAISKSNLTGTNCIDINESQVLVRGNVDDEGIHVVYIDSPATDRGNDLDTLDQTIAVLQDLRARLALLQESGR